MVALAIFLRFNFCQIILQGKKLTVFSPILLHAKDVTATWRLGEMITSHTDKVNHRKSLEWEQSGK